jgi:hypothetical protein
MSIIVFVVITGLALAQLNQSDGVSIDFPLTQGFLVPGDTEMQSEDVAWSIEHEFKVEVHKKNNTETLTVGKDKKLAISLGMANNIDFGAANNFPDLTTLHGGAIRGNRVNCRTPDPLACRALSQPDQDGIRTIRDLLAARAELSGGKWTLKAFGDDGQGGYSSTSSLWPVVRFRTPALDPSNSLSHPFAGGRLASILVFRGELTNQIPKVTVTLDGNSHDYAAADAIATGECESYGSPAGTPCIVIKLTNHRPCSDCPLAPWARDNADTDFLQLYRLLDVYDPRRDELRRVRPMMPYPVDPENFTLGGGASSPRCYPAVKT